MKAILVLDLEHPNENIDIEGTQATYIELKTKKGIRRISLMGHWLEHHKDYIPVEWIESNIPFQHNEDGNILRDMIRV